MLKLLRSQQSCLNWFRQADALTPLTLGIVLLTSVGMPVEARPVVVQVQSVVQSPSCASYIYGSPIPTPMPVNPLTGQACSSVSTPARGVIENSILINPTVINSTISDSVLVDPVIINSPRSSRTILTRDRVIYNSPGSLRIPIGR